MKKKLIKNLQKLNLLQIQSIKSSNFLNKKKFDSLKNFKGFDNKKNSIKNFILKSKILENNSTLSKDFSFENLLKPSKIETVDPIEQKLKILITNQYYEYRVKEALEFWKKKFRIYPKNFILEFLDNVPFLPH